MGSAGDAVFRTCFYFCQYVHNAGDFAGTQPGFSYQRADGGIDRFFAGAGGGDRVAVLWAAFGPRWAEACDGGDQFPGDCSDAVMRAGAEFWRAGSAAYHGGAAYA